jgi:prolipoprotein diacylglyceryltransferase
VGPTGLVAAFIRLGNLMNHEIYGHVTDQPWGFRFIENLHAWRRGTEPVFTAPSHPTQLYEAGCYLLTFALCMWLYFKKDAYKKEGLIFGLFMICIFGSRFFIEFFKNNQEAFEVKMQEAIFINMGQLLSIPFVLAGIYFVRKALIKNSTYETKRNSK